ncbi:MAG: PKD domain-containing protein, partial [Saprospiraceae bacterium]|nr:PKD domain-containing protein [Saprospiraceae bacterium]
GTDGGVYIGTNAGVFYRNNSHPDWQPYSTGLPLSVETNRLKPFYRDNKIRNGCWGFGVWESELYEPSLPQAIPTVAAPLIRCNRDTVYFDDYSVLNHAGATWSWSFPGASWVNSSSIRNPKVIYSQNGSYDVTLTVTDAAGNSSVRTITSMVTMASECAPDSIAGKALQASGSAMHGYVPSFGMEDVDSLTVTAWVRPTGIQPDYSAIFMGDGTDAAGFNFKDGTNKLAYHWPGGQWWWNSNINVPANQWSFVAMVVRPTGITLYCNEQSATHTFTLTPTDIPAFRIGSYRNWGSRNMNGLIDEVAIYDRPLSTAEIRELRHLTKKPSQDGSLIAYYQFNSSSTHDYDKVGTRHIYLTSGTTKVTSTAPVGGGVSQRMTINSGGTKQFQIPGISLYLRSGSTYPNGEVVVSKLNVQHVQPDQFPASSYPPNGYWILNNYGTNAVFTDADSVRFSGSGNITTGCQDLDYLFYKRSANAEGATWSSPYEAIHFEGLANPAFVTFDHQARVNGSLQLYMVRDNDPYPSSWEICNGIDDDCDGLIDEDYGLLVTSDANAGPNTLRAILQCAQSGDTIRFASSIDTIVLESPLVFTKDLVVLDDSGGEVVLAIDLQAAGFANATGGLINTAGASTTFSHVNVWHQGNNASKPVVLNLGSLTLDQCVFSGNPASVIKNEVGAACVTSGIVRIE